MVTEHFEVDSEGQMQLPDDDEEDLCKVWDMAMDKVQVLICVPQASHSYLLTGTLYEQCHFQGMNGIHKSNYNPIEKKCMKTYCVLSKWDDL